MKKETDVYLISRASTSGDGRAGPDREHVRREPFSGDAVDVREFVQCRWLAFGVSCAGEEELS